MNFEFVGLIWSAINIGYGFVNEHGHRIEVRVYDYGNCYGDFFIFARDGALIGVEIDTVPIFDKALWAEENADNFVNDFWT